MCVFIWEAGSQEKQGADGIVRKEGKSAHRETKMLKTTFPDFLTWLRAGLLVPFFLF